MVVIVEWIKEGGDGDDGALMIMSVVGYGRRDSGYGDGDSGDRDGGSGGGDGGMDGGDGNGSGKGDVCSE